MRKKIQSGVIVGNNFRLEENQVGGVLLFTGQGCEIETIIPKERLAEIILKGIASEVSC